MWRKQAHAALRSLDMTLEYPLVLQPQEDVQQQALSVRDQELLQTRMAVVSVVVLVYLLPRAGLRFGTMTATVPSAVVRIPHNFFCISN